MLCNEILEFDFRPKAFQAQSIDDGPTEDDRLPISHRTGGFRER